MQQFIWNHPLSRVIPLKKWMPYLRKLLLMPFFLTPVIGLAWINSVDVTVPLPAQVQKMSNPEPTWTSHFDRNLELNPDTISSLLPPSSEYKKYRKRKVWFVSAKGSECHDVGKRYQNKLNPLPVIALLSTQGSGNTWLRWLIERLTGICTGSAYKEYIMQKSGFQCELGSPDTGTAIVYKTHYLQHLNTTKVLLLVRNPYEALISDYNRMMTNGNHTAIADSEVFRTPEWHSYVLERTADWITQISLAVQHADELLVVFYENLKINPAKDLLRIAYFLGVRINEYRIKCVLENSRGFAKRPTRTNPLPKNIFTVDEITVINDRILKAYELFKRHQVPSIPPFYQSSTVQFSSFRNST